MSFASDLGAPIGSEKHFIKNGWDTLGKGGRSLWDNSAHFVKLFLTDIPTASVVGLQEMNSREKLNKPDFMGGTDAVKELLKDMPNLIFKECSVETKFGWPTLLTIWKKDKLGECTKEYCADLGNYSEYASLGPQHKGRPISIIQTEKGFTLINLHAPNLPSDSLTGAPIFRNALQDNINNCGFTNDIDINKLFIMGDFNDPHNAIKFSKPLIINGEPLFHSNSDTKTLSCCYNFNSSCPDELYNNTDLEDTKDGLTASPKECYINRSENMDLNEELRGKTKSLGDRGKLSNYKFTGDYVLGANVVRPLSIWRPVPRDISLESDHEMVMATFETPYAGGRRKKTRRIKKRKNRKTKVRKPRY
jgi:hypothetical protein